ncbi:MAG: hypothetical protein ACI4K9_01390 [Candidatus Fimenecus sp.]
MRCSFIKIVMLCGILLLAAFTLASCGQKTEFEKVEVSGAQTDTEIQTAAVDAVPVLTEPSADEGTSETTTRRRTSTTQNHTDTDAQAPAETPEASADGETPAAPQSPEIPESPAEPETPDEPNPPTETEVSEETTEASAESGELVSEVTE